MGSRDHSACTRIGDSVNIIATIGFFIKKACDNLPDAWPLSATLALLMFKLGVTGWFSAYLPNIGEAGSVWHLVASAIGLRILCGRYLRDHVHDIRYADSVTKPEVKIELRSLLKK